MTDPLHPPDDELVSAHLDGEATPDEAARVQADNASRERLAEFETIRDRVAGRVVVPPFMRESSIAAALDVFDLEVAPSQAQTRPAWDAPPGSSTREEPPPPQLIDLAAPEPPADLAARRGQHRRIQILSAAAAIVAVLLLATAVRVGTRSAEVSNADQASSPIAPTTKAAPEAADEQSGNQKLDAATTSTMDGPLSNQGPPTTTPVTPDPGGGQAAPSASGTPPTTAAGSNTASSTVPNPASDYSFIGADLGALATPAELRRAVSTVDFSSSTPTSETSARSAMTDLVAGCDPTLRRQDAEIGALGFVASATYQGTPAVVLVYAIDRSVHPAANGSTRIYALDRSNCAVLSNQTI